MRLPRKIFIESTALFQLGSHLQKPEFAKLLERRDLLKFDLFVAEVSWLEYIRHRKKKILNLQGTIGKVKANLGEFDQDCTGVNDTQEGLATYLGNIEKIFEDKARTAGIQIVPLPQLDVHRLMHMSIQSVPPFEEPETGTWEKGFRDSLIMFTILEVIRNRPEDNGLVITGDKRLKEGLRQFASDFKTRVDTVDDLEKAIEYVDSRATAWYREKLQKESHEAKEMLLKYKDEISASVQSIRELTDSDLGLGLFQALLRKPSLEPGETIEKVHSLRLDSIESAIWKDRQRPLSKILFRIRCIASVTASGPLFDSSLFSSKYMVGGEKQVNWKVFSGRNRTMEKELPVRLYGEAQLERVEESWKLSNLEVDKSPPPVEELARLRFAQSE